MKQKWKRPLALLLSVAMMFSMSGTPVYAADVEMGASAVCPHHVHDETCGYSEGTPCTHEHTDDCYSLVTQCVHEHTAECYSDGMLPAEGEEKEADACSHVCSEESGCITKELNCPHVHDETCGYSEGSPCTFDAADCELCNFQENPAEQTILSWEWIGADNLNEGVLALPDVSAENPVDLDAVVSMLPTGITATVDGSADSVELALTWSCGDFPETASAGEYTFTAALPEGYTLGEETAAPTVAVVLGGAQTLAITPGRPTGDGTEQNPYQIGTAAELLWFGQQVADDYYSYSAWATLTADINMEGEIWPTLVEYSGTFDGAGHTISNLTIPQGFVSLLTGGTIKNLTLDATCRVTGPGSICGSLSENGTIQNCTNKADVTNSAGAAWAGGICGQLYTTGTIENCINLGKVTGLGIAGGICGQQMAGTIQNCSNIGTVAIRASEGEAGAICGRLSDGSIFNCHWLSGSCGSAIGYTAPVTTITTDGLYSWNEEAFASGKVCFLLNKSSSGEGTVWRQNLDNGQTSDPYPVLDSTHSIVYINGANYTNTKPKHTFDEDGFCTEPGCSYYQPAVEVNGVYQIYNNGQLLWFAAFVNNDAAHAQYETSDPSADAMLMNDLALNHTIDGAATWVPIGYRDISYCGTFDGNGKTISNLVTNGEKYQGFVGHLGDGGVIQNLTLDATCSVTSSTSNYSSNYLGGICGRQSGGTIQNCANYAEVSGRNYVGGICGSQEGNSTIKFCYNASVNIYGNGATGGICGSQDGNSTIEFCYNSGKVDSYGPYEGAISGWLEAGCTIRNCYWLQGSCSTGYFDEGGTAENVEQKTAEEFASGAVCFLLNNSTSKDVAWHQSVDNGETVDAFPVLDSSHGTVYHGSWHCGSVTKEYTNNPDFQSQNEHSFDESAICTNCGAYQPAEAQNGVYQIKNVGNLFWFAALVNGDTNQEDITQAVPTANAVLTVDIDLGGREWAPIAPSTTFKSNATTVEDTTNKSYSGTFDGQGHTISNFKIRTNRAELTSGLFGAVTGTIENLGVVNATFDNIGSYDGRFGALCGLLVKDSSTATAARIENCYVTGSSILSASKIAGAIAGANYGGTIENCFECGNKVSGHSRIGHLVGDNQNDASTGTMIGTVTNCYSDTQLAGTQGGTVNGGGVKDADDFASGEVAYLLNGSSSDSPVWYQNLDNGQTVDSYPVLDSSHGIVYFIEEEPVRYSNDPNATAEPTDISSATVTLNQSSFTYNGQSQRPTVTVTLGDKTLTEGTHYTVTYSGDGINAGTYTVTVTGTGNYTGEATNKPSYTINKATPTLTWSEGSQTLPYTGSPADITAPTVNLVNNETYSGTISYQYKASGESEYTDGLPTDVGTYTVMASIAAQGNYTEATSGELTLTIEGAAATGTVTAVENLTYNGQAQNLVTAGAVTGGEIQYSLTGGDDYTDTIPTGTDAKTYTVWYKVVGDENHSDSAPTSVNVTIAKLPVELTWSNTDFTYDGSAKCPTATVSNKANDTDEVNVTVSGGQTNASDTAYTATVTDLTGAAAGNYTLTGCQNTSHEFTIAKADSNVNAPTNLTATYGSTLNDVTLPDGWAWDDAVTTSVGNVGNNTFSATYTPSDTTNYNTVNEDLTVTVSAKDITGAVITLGGSLTYTGQQQTQQIASVTVDGLTVTYTVTGNTGTDAGDYNLTVTGTGNFTGTATKGWSIAKANYDGPTGVLGTVLANWSDKVTLPDVPAGASYGAASTTDDLTGLSIEGSVLSYTGGSGITEGQAYKITVPVNGGNNYENYDITVTLTGTDKQVLDITGVTAQGGTYNGQPYQGYTGTPSAEGFTGEFVVTYNTTDQAAPVDAGTYTVTIAIPEDNAQYVGSIDLQFTIAPKALTVSAPSPSVYVGDSAPELALTYTGLVAGESVTPSQEPDFTITKSDNTVIDLEDAVKTVGTYTITWSNADGTTFTSGDNYTITKNLTGTLKVSNRSSGGTTTYPVQVEENSQNGGVQVSPKNAVPGTLVTVTPQPALGYELATLSVLDQYGNEVDVNPLGNGNYSFKMPRSRVKVEATFYCTGSELCPTHHLADVLVKAWYHDAVDYVVEHGIMTGTSATTFEPNTTLSRAMVAQILYNLEGQPAVEGESTFTDASTHWAVDAITWAQKTGVVDGYENNTFRPNQAVTREELAQMLYNYAQYKKITLPALGDLSKFPDGDKVSPWARTAMKWATGLGVINGYEDSTLEPGGDSTRAQAASILMNFDVNLVEE